MKKYSKIYPVEGEKHFGFRYNYTDALLEYVSRWDCEMKDGELVDIIHKNWRVAAGIGLSRNDWKDNPEYWVETYKAEIDAETAHIVKYI